MTPRERLRTSLEWNDDGTERPPPSDPELWAMYQAYEAERHAQHADVLPDPAETRRRPLVGHVQPTKALVYCNFTSYIATISKVCARCLRRCALAYSPFLTARRSCI